MPGACGGNTGGCLPALRRKRPVSLPGECPTTSGQPLGHCPEIDRQCRRMLRRMDFGNAAGHPADSPADSGRRCGVIAAGNSPENRRTQNPCEYKGFGFFSLKRIETHFASFVAIILHASFLAVRRHLQRGWFAQWRSLGFVQRSARPSCCSASAWPNARLVR